MNDNKAFLQHLTEKGKEQAYIDMSREVLDSFNKMLGEHDV